MAAEVLSISGLHAWYGESHILHGVDLEVPAQTLQHFGKDFACNENFRFHQFP